jgi:hypothetical protein
MSRVRPALRDLRAGPKDRYSIAVLTRALDLGRLGGRYTKLELSQLVINVAT